MCGIVGIASNSRDVARDLYLANWGQMTRGKESSRIVTFDDQYHLIGGMGTPDVVFRGEGALQTLKGRCGIGHDRYSTTGGSSTHNIQPIEGVFNGTPFWLAHNGNFVGYQKVKEWCERKGYLFKTTTDTEVLAALIYYSRKTNFQDALKWALQQIHGTYALIVLYKDQVMGVCDPSGNRPLVLGSGNDINLLASESAVCDIIGIDVIRDINPGELVTFSDGYNENIKSEVLLKKSISHPCIFEFIYFLRPDSIWHNLRMQIVREKMGTVLWDEHPLKADIIVPAPDSGNAAAIGYAQASQIPLVFALFRYHGVGRTFIDPIQNMRDENMRIKLNVIPELVKGKIVVIVDDSIVRGTVTRRVTNMLLDAGAKEVHIRIASPPYMHPCYYGIDTYRVQNELIALRHDGDIDAICTEIGASSLAYLSLAGLKRAIIESGSDGLSEASFCDACFTGNYHIPIEE
ncbi:amidophosphoribosyltransferase [Candidatus Uhrbacteria bacterium RIFCSPLOWO2_02_FULL_49_11]|uniref:Amidophosphoribosyltransferase n=1 Tax=Candidatus Uhrbacteria bacterium RIFCSPLOWO2_02_FULL_49_11 TaxID=1802409 RepID=A0A1F7VD27_9BACT|nr:MAG: amidophosphoribosyltransferase [Candidatus Uhrbacteria bacterium RIFCSPLOWO2_02_FULL_49_11]